LVFGLVFASRLPFLDAGYGTDPDAWRMAEASHRIAVEHRYTTSRLPGYPVPEIAGAFVSHGGPPATNALTALMSAAAALCLFRLLRCLGCAHAVLGALAFAFTPIVYANSTNAMDYLWALALGTAALLAAVSGRPAWAGVALGFAVGSRLGSALLAAPLAWLLYSNGAGPRGLSRFALAAGAATLASLLPVLLEYGPGFLSFTDFQGHRAQELFAALGLRFFGRFGAALLVAALLLGAWDRVRAGRPSALRSPVPGVGGACALGIGLTLTLFLRLPHEAEYLLPALPFLVVGLGLALSARAFALACVAMAVASFPLRPAIAPEATPPGFHVSLPGVGTLGLRAREGAVFRARGARLEGMEVARAALEHAHALPSTAVLVAGWREPTVLGLARLGEGPPPNARIVYLLDAEELARLPRPREALYFLPGQDTFSLELRGVDLVAAGARPLLPEPAEAGPP